MNKLSKFILLSALIAFTSMLQAQSINLPQPITKPQTKALNQTFEEAQQAAKPRFSNNQTFDETQKNLPPQPTNLPQTRLIYLNNL